MHLPQRKSRKEYSLEKKNQHYTFRNYNIQTPINGIRGMAIMAEKSLDHPEQAREDIHKILKSFEYLEMLLDDILKMSKLESGNISFEEKTFDLREIIQQTVEFIEERAQEKQIMLCVEEMDITHTYVIGSPLHLRQVMQNIMSNAVKFTDKGGKLRIWCGEKILSEDHVIFEFICEDTAGYFLNNLRFLKILAVWLVYKDVENCYNFMYRKEKERGGHIDGKGQNMLYPAKKGSQAFEGCRRRKYNCLYLRSERYWQDRTDCPLFKTEKISDV